MTTATIERAFQLARSGEVADLPSLKLRLKADGYRAVDALLSPRMLSGHLQAICAAASKVREASIPPAATVQDGSAAPATPRGQ